MSKTFREWISEGETIYTEAIEEYRSLQSQIEQLEARLSEKRTEVNQIAQIIGKPPVDGPRKISAQLVENQPSPTGTVGPVTRALTGRTMVARESVAARL